MKSNRLCAFQIQWRDRHGIDIPFPKGENVKKGIIVSQQVQNLKGHWDRGTTCGTHLKSLGDPIPQLCWVQPMQQLSQIRLLCLPLSGSGVQSGPDPTDPLVTALLGLSAVAPLPPEPAALGGSILPNVSGDIHAPRAHSCTLSSIGIPKVYSRALLRGSHLAPLCNPRPPARGS